MNKSELIKAIKDIAIHFGTEPTYIEKDLYVTKVIKSISNVNDEKFEIIFGGGTSLLKAHKVIHRFSEDIDFKVLIKNPNVSRNDKRNYRDLILSTLKTDKEFIVKNESLMVRDESNFFSCYIEYPKHFGENTSIRPEIKLEVKFVYDNLIEKNKMTIKSMISEFILIDEAFNIKCVSKLEILADKISAFLWRTLSKKIYDSSYDKTVIRHLHDISCLYNSILQKEQTLAKTKAIEIYNIDVKRVKHNLPDFHDACQLVLTILKTDRDFRDDYFQFVLNMCFGDAPSYSEAINNFERLLID